MAVTSIQLQKERASINDGKYSCTREYQVGFNPPSSGSIWGAMFAHIPDGASIPPYGSAHPNNGLIRATAINAELVNNTLHHYKVTVEYTSKEQAQAADNPLERSPEISWSYENATEPYFEDCTPESEEGPFVVVNSAGEPFENYLERECGTLTITITRNELTYDAAALDQFSHTVNSQPVRIDNTIYAPGTLKLSPITAVKARETYTDENGDPVVVTYYKRTYILKASRKGWNHKVLDVGVNELVQVPNGDPDYPGVTVAQLKPILDRNKKQVTKPYPLDGEGKKRMNAKDKAAEKTFQPYVTKDWENINLLEVIP